MNKWICAYIVGALLSAQLIIGWENADLQTYSSFRSGRTLLGRAVIMGIVLSAIWPVGLVVSYCGTGFAEKGWSLDYKK